MSFYVVAAWTVQVNIPTSRASVIFSDVDFNVVDNIDQSTFLDDFLVLLRGIPEREMTT